MATTTRLAFDAKIATIAVRPAKDNGSRNRFDLGLTIEQPDAPRRPNVPFEFSDGPDRSKWKPRPPLPKRKPNESDEEFDDRCGNEVKQRDRYEAARASYNDGLQRYVKELAEYRIRVMAYASLVGLASVFGHQTVNVVITPSNQDILPGFAAELIAPVEPGAGAELPFDPDEPD